MIFETINNLENAIELFECALYYSGDLGDEGRRLVRSAAAKLLAITETEIFKLNENFR